MSACDVCMWRVHVMCACHVCMSCVPISHQPFHILLLPSSSYTEGVWAGVVCRSMQTHWILMLRKYDAHTLMAHAYWCTDVPSYSFVAPFVAASTHVCTYVCTQLLDSEFKSTFDTESARPLQGWVQSVDTCTALRHLCGPFIVCCWRMWNCACLYVCAYVCTYACLMSCWSCHCQLIMQCCVQWVLWRDSHLWAGLCVGEFPP